MSGEQHFHHICMMMFLFKTRPCASFQESKSCEFHENECFDYHDSAKRRRVPQWVHGRWNYSATEKCHAGYGHIIIKWKKGDKCIGDKCNHHHSLFEMNFHPEEYKTRPCPMTDKCWRGPMCWFFHNDSDRMTKESYIPASLQEASISVYAQPPTEFVHFFRNRNAQKQAPKHVRTAPPMQDLSQQASVSHAPRGPPTSSTQQVRRDTATEQKHNAWLAANARFFQMFKYEACGQAASCPKNFNCMKFHSNEDRRRPLAAITYICEPCPHIFDYHGTQTFALGQCPNGDKCNYAHSFFELGFHHRTYKTVACRYQTCPFIKDSEYIRQHFPNMCATKLTVRNNIIKLDHGAVAAIDMCPFYHNEQEHRFHDDPPFPLPRKQVRDGASSEHSSSQYSQAQ